MEVIEGRSAEADLEVVLERRYTEEHNLQPGDKITIVDKEFEVVGIGCSPDYEALKEMLTELEISNLTHFLKVEDNPRISGTIEESKFG